MHIARLADDYKVTKTEVETRDTQLVAYGLWRYDEVPIGFVLRDGAARWVVRESARWKHIVEEWKRVGSIYAGYSTAVGQLWRAVREETGGWQTI